MTVHREHSGAPGIDGLQRWLFERVTSPRPAVGGAGAGHVSPGGLPASARLEVYRHGYFARLVECLADDYPAVAHALGPEAFEALCRGYILAHPPRSASLNFYGAAFAGFCRQQGEALAFEADLAQLEWAVVEAIHGDAQALEPTALGTLGAEQWAVARLVPSPALRLVRAAYPVHGYYRAFLEGEAPARPSPEATAVAVCRRGDDVWRLELAEPLAELLARLVAGERLTAALDEAASPALGALAPGALQRAFGEWVACGFFAALALG